MAHSLNSESMNAHCICLMFPFNIITFQTVHFWLFQHPVHEKKNAKQQTCSSVSTIQQIAWSLSYPNQSIFKEAFVWLERGQKKKLVINYTWISLLKLLKIPPTVSPSRAIPCKRALTFKSEAILGTFWLWRWFNNGSKTEYLVEFQWLGVKQSFREAFLSPVVHILIRKISKYIQIFQII